MINFSMLKAYLIIYESIVNQNQNIRRLSLYTSLVFVFSSRLNNKCELAFKRISLKTLQQMLLLFSLMHARSYQFARSSNILQKNNSSSFSPSPPLSLVTTIKSKHMLQITKLDARARVSFNGSSPFQGEAEERIQGLFISLQFWILEYSSSHRFTDPDKPHVRLLDKTVCSDSNTCCDGFLIASYNIPDMG